MKLSEYVEALTGDDPGFEKYYKEWVRITPSKRKVRLFLDRNLPDELKEELKAHRIFKIVGIARENDPDEYIWHKARSQNAAILSLDKGDFWNDKKFLLHESPGVILISSRGQSVDLYITALVRFLYRIVIAGVRRSPDYLKKMKFKVSTKGFVHKFITQAGSVETYDIEYD